MLLPTTYLQLLILTIAMQSHCSKCNKDFSERVGMGPMESNLAIRVRNKMGNICPECRAEIAKTKRGRWSLFFYNLKVAFYCACLLLPVVAIFAALIVCLALFVL